MKRILESDFCYQNLSKKACIFAYYYCFKPRNFFFIQLSNDLISENSESNVVVGDLQTIDQDANQQHSYQLVNDAGGRFEIVNKTVRVCEYIGPSNGSFKIELNT